MSARAFFMPGEAGQRYCVLHSPSAGQPWRGLILHLPAFAEEMNKSRRLVALQARALAQAGYAVLVLDPLGCGDSSGDHGDASWEAWLADARRAADWLRAEAGPHAGATSQLSPLPLWLWGLRSGCLLACALAAEVQAGLLLWQPVASGKQFFQQFLRLKMAGELLGGDAKGVIDGLRQALARDESIEVAGYAVAPALARGLEAAELVNPAPGSRALWLEVSGQAEPRLSPVAQTRIERWRSAGVAVEARVVAGQSFWQTAEITDCPALVESTLQLLAETSA